MAGYDKGFGGGGREQGASSRGERSGPGSRGASAAPKHARRDFGEVGAGQEAHGSPPGVESIGVAGADAVVHRSRAWPDYSGRVGWTMAGVGLLGGLASLVTTGNWAAPLVLPVLLGVSSAMVFWLLASVAEVFRRRR